MQYYMTVPLANIAIGKILLVVFSDPARVWTAGSHQDKGRWLSQKIRFQVQQSHPSRGDGHTDMCAFVKKGRVEATIQ